MEKIASFTVDHNRLSKGMYISRRDFDDIITYDIRMKVPNKGDFLSTGAAHTIEHLFATYARNSETGSTIIYVGPMGCRTGFYLITQGLEPAQAIELVQKSMAFVRDFEGEIPGNKPEECGNYLDHDIPGAKAVCADMAEVLKDWTPANLEYEHYLD